LQKNEDFGEGTGYEKLFIAMSRAEIVASSGAAEDEVIKAWEFAADVGKSLKIPTSKVGPSMRWLVVLIEAKQFKAAEELARKLVAKDKANPELQRRLLRTLVEQGKSKEAIELGQRTLKSSYGRNELWVVEQLVKAYIAADKNQEARKLLDAYLNRPEINWPNMKSTKKTLEGFKAKIN
jgi:predicted Zn-dependent protease